MLRVPAPVQLWMQDRTTTQANAASQRRILPYSASLLHSGPQLIGQGPPPMRTTVCFTRILISSRNALTDTPRMLPDRVCGHRRPVKLPPKTSHCLSASLPAPATSSQKVTVMAFQAGPVTEITCPRQHP